MALSAMNEETRGYLLNDAYPGDPERIGIPEAFTRQSDFAIDRSYVFSESARTRRKLVFNEIIPLWRLMKFDPVILCLAINYVDRYLSRNQTWPEEEGLAEDDSVFLFGVSCLAIAWKTRTGSCQIYKMKDRTTITSEHYSHMLQMVHQQLGSQASSLTALTFFDYYISIVPLGIPIEQHRDLKALASQIYISYMLVDIRFKLLPASVHAASALDKAFDVLNHSLLYRYKAAIDIIPYVDEDHVAFCNKLLRSCLEASYSKQQTEAAPAPVQVQEAPPTEAEEEKAVEEMDTSDGKPSQAVEEMGISEDKPSPTTVIATDDAAREQAPVISESDEGVSRKLGAQKSGESGFNGCGNAGDHLETAEAEAAPDPVQVLEAPPTEAEEEKAVEEMDTSEGKPSQDVEEMDTSEGKPSQDVEEMGTSEGKPSQDVEEMDTSEGKPSQDVEEMGTSECKPSPTTVIATDDETREQAPVISESDEGVSRKMEAQKSGESGFNGRGDAGV